MKSAIDAILRTDQAAYLEPLQAAGMHALATLAGAGPQRRPDPLLAKMERRAAELSYPISDPEVALLLSILARLSRPKLVVELGTNIGYGAIVLARAAGEGSRVITIEKSPELVSEARGFVAEAGLADRIEIRKGMAIPELEKIDGPIDFVYIDCVKEEYARYLDIAAPKMSIGGVVVADNVMWKGLVASRSPPPHEEERARALGAFNQALMSRPDLCSVILPLGDGVGLAVRI